MENKLEGIMKKEGWVLGYTKHCNVKYWSFRKGDLEIPLSDVNEICPLDNEDHRNFEAWRKA